MFFFSHKRVWALIEENEDGTEITFGGDANRNHIGFEEKFNKVVEDAKASL